MSDKYHIGLDIGANTIKAVSLSPTKTGFVVDRFRNNTFEGVVTENGIINDYGELVNRILETIDASFPVRTVAVALKGPSVLVRKMLVNNDSLGDLKEFRWIADQYACVEPEEMCMDFETLPSQDLYNHTSIVMTAAKKDIITDFVSVIESAKLQTYAIESEDMSIVRLFRALKKTNNSEIQLILHVGYIGSFVILMKNGFFDYCREVSRGGKYFTDLIKHDLDVDNATAEKIKINPEEYSEPEKVRTTLDRIFSIEYIQEIDYVLKFYLLRGGSLPNHIYLSGGACQTFGLEKSLREKYGVPVEYLNPWEFIVLPENTGKVQQKDKYSYSVVLGLALHGLVY